MPVRSVLMPQPPVLPHHDRWAADAAIIALMLLAACSGSNSLSATALIEMDTGGLTIRINLSRTVDLPLDEDDATLIMNECGCPCQGDLEYEHGYWQFQGESCLIRIEADTGHVSCRMTG